MDRWMLLLTAIAAAGAITTWLRWWLERGQYDIEISTVRKVELIKLREAGEGEFLVRVRSLSNRTVTGVRVQGFGAQLFPRAEVANRLEPDQESDFFSFNLDDESEDAWVLIMFRPHGSAWTHMTWRPIHPAGELAEVRSHQELRPWWRSVAARLATAPLPSPLSVASGRVRGGQRGLLKLQQRSQKIRGRRTTWWRRVLLHLAAGGRRPPARPSGANGRP